MAIEDYYTDLTLEVATISESGYTTETTYSSSTIRGVINQAGTSEIEYASARQITVDYKAYVEVNATTEAIKKNDKINGYRVTGTPKNTLGRNHHLKILLAEVE